MCVGWTEHGGEWGMEVVSGAILVVVAVVVLVES